MENKFFIKVLDFLNSLKVIVVAAAVTICTSLCMAKKRQIVPERSVELSLLVRAVAQYSSLVLATAGLRGERARVSKIFIDRKASEIFTLIDKAVGSMPKKAATGVRNSVDAAYEYLLSDATTETPKIARKYLALPPWSRTKQIKRRKFVRDLRQVIRASLAQELRKGLAPSSAKAWSKALRLIKACFIELRDGLIKNRGWHFVDMEVFDKTLRYLDTVEEPSVYDRLQVAFDKYWQSHSVEIKRQVNLLQNNAIAGIPVGLLGFLILSLRDWLLKVDYGDSALSPVGGLVAALAAGASIVPLVGAIRDVDFYELLNFANFSVKH